MSRVSDRTSPLPNTEQRRLRRRTPSSRQRWRPRVLGPLRLCIHWCGAPGCQCPSGVNHRRRRACRGARRAIGHLCRFRLDDRRRGATDGSHRRGALCCAKRRGHFRRRILRDRTRWLQRRGGPSRGGGRRLGDGGDAGGNRSDCAQRRGLPRLRLSRLSRVRSSHPIHRLPPLRPNSPVHTCRHQVHNCRSEPGDVEVVSTWRPT